MWPFASKQDVQEELNKHTQAITQALINALPPALTTVFQETLTTELQKLPKPPEFRLPTNLVLLPQKVDAQQKHLDSIAVSLAKLTSASRKVDEIHGHIVELTTALTQLSFTTPDGEQKAIHERVNVHILRAKQALEELGQEHASWLADQTRTMHEARVKAEETVQRMDMAIAHLGPPPSGSNGTEQVDL